MYNKPPTSPSPKTDAKPDKGPSLISSDLMVEGDITGGPELQIDGTIKGDVKVERVTVGTGGQVEGGIFAETVEVRGKVTGSITAKQVRLYGDCHVDGDITHEQLAMETGAFFQGRSLRLQKPATAPSSPPKAETTETPSPGPGAEAAGDKPTPGPKPPLPPLSSPIRT